MNRSQVRNVPSVIAVGPVQQSVSRGVHRNFVRTRSFVAGSSFSQRIKTIYLLGTKVKHFKFCFTHHHPPPPLFFYTWTCRKKAIASQIHLQPHFLLLLALVHVFSGSTNTIYFGVGCQQLLPPQKKCCPESAGLEKSADIARLGAERCIESSHRCTNTSCEKGFANQALAFNAPFKGLD